MLRALILLLLLGMLAFFLDREQSAGRFQQADDWFLDFLLANSRERFEKGEKSPADDVVLVQMREEERAEYAAWPPPPIDWQMVLKALAACEPEVLVIAAPLAWGQPPPEFVPQVSEALLPFPSVVLAVAATLTDGNVKSTTDAAAETLLAEAFPKITRLGGQLEFARQLAAIIAAPDESMRRQVELGLMPPAPTTADAPAALPLIIQSRSAVAPSLLLQALSRHSRAPYSQIRLILGPGAGVHLGKGIYLPLDPAGAFVVNPRLEVPTVNALDLMTGGLADALSAADRAKLGKGKIVVVGLDGDAAAPSIARLQAQALAQALALPRIRGLDQIGRWLVCAAAALLGLGLLRCRGGKAFRAGLLVIFVALMAGFVLFQSSLIWCPPTAPTAILAASTLFAMMFGKRPKASDEAGKDAAPVPA